MKNQIKGTVAACLAVLLVFLAGCGGKTSPDIIITGFNIDTKCRLVIQLTITQGQKTSTPQSEVDPATGRLTVNPGSTDIDFTKSVTITLKVISAEGCGNYALPGQSYTGVLPTNSQGSYEIPVGSFK